MRLAQITEPIRYLIAPQRAGDLKSRKRFISRMLNQFYLKFVFFFTRSLCSVLTKQKQKTHTLEVVQLTGQIRLAVVPSPYSFLPVTLPSSFFFFFCIRLKFIFIVTTLRSRTKALNYPWRVRTTFFTFPFFLGWKIRKVLSGRLISAP